MIGKGARLPEVVEAMKKYSGVYFGAIAGQEHFLRNASRKQNLLPTKTFSPKHSADFM